MALYGLSRAAFFFRLSFCPRLPKLCEPTGASPLARGAFKPFHSLRNRDAIGQEPVLAPLRAPVIIAGGRRSIHSCPKLAKTKPCILEKPPPVLLQGFSLVGLFAENLFGYRLPAAHRADGGNVPLHMTRSSISKIAAVSQVFSGTAISHERQMALLRQTRMPS